MRVHGESRRDFCFMLYQVYQVQLINVIGDQYKVTSLDFSITLYYEIMQRVLGEHRRDLHLMLCQVAEST